MAVCSARTRTCFSAIWRTPASWYQTGAERLHGLYSGRTVPAVPKRHVRFACFRPGHIQKRRRGGSVRPTAWAAVNILTRLPGVDRRAELLARRSSRLGSADQGAVLAKHFWTSDFTVLHRENFYVSVRNSSKRNKTTEYMNNENSKAYYIADGTTVIMRTGGEYRDIFPVWDWSRIPAPPRPICPLPRSRPCPRNMAAASLWAARTTAALP